MSEHVHDVAYDIWWEALDDSLKVDAAVLVILVKSFMRICIRLPKIVSISVRRMNYGG